MSASSEEDLMLEGGDPTTDSKLKEETDIILTENLAGEGSKQQTIEKESTGSNLLCSDNSENSEGNEHNETRKSLNRLNSNESDLNQNNEPSDLNAQENDGGLYSIGIPRTIDFNANKIMIPPPEALIKKSVILQEPAKTGAQIAFLKLQRFIGKELGDRLNAPRDKMQPPADRYVGEVAQNTSIADYLINNNSLGKIVYCRFGEKYIADLEKRKNSLLSQNNQPCTTLATASYLINVRKLIEEHNIKGEKRDFKVMKTKQMGKTMEAAP